MTTIEDFDIVRSKLMRERYEQKLIQFRKLITVFRYDIIKEDDPEFVAAKKWLKDNFSIEYLDLF